MQIDGDDIIDWQICDIENILESITAKMNLLDERVMSIEQRVFGVTQKEE